MSPTEVGRRVEALVADRLALSGHRILARNWRTRWCELDLVTERSGVIHIIEVKYRRRSDQGHGYDYITPVKLRRLVAAADAYMAAHAPTADYQIDVASVVGPDTSATVTIIENVTG